MVRRDDFDTILSPMDRTSRKEKKKETNRKLSETKWA